jgi:hypothetical protein
MAHSMTAFAGLNGPCANPQSLDELPDRQLAIGNGRATYAYMPRIFVTVATRLIATM